MKKRVINKVHPDATTMKKWCQVWMSASPNPIYVAGYDGKDGERKALERASELQCHGFEAWVEVK